MKKDLLELLEKWKKEEAIILGMDIKEIQDKIQILSVLREHIKDIENIIKKGNDERN